MAKLLVFLSGFIFAVGLSLSQMTQPDRILGFLDIFGAWDPTLAFVMGSGVITVAIGFRLVLRRSQPLFGSVFLVPGKAGIDARLLGGAGLFGIGWGLSGFCPGPAVVAAVTGVTEVLLFVAAMVLGMVLQQLFAARFPSAGAAPDCVGNLGDNR
jgi:uncharacterized protein